MHLLGMGGRRLDSPDLVPAVQTRLTDREASARFWRPRMPHSVSSCRRMHFPALRQ